MLAADLSMAIGLSTSSTLTRLFILTLSSCIYTDVVRLIWPLGRLIEFGADVLYDIVWRDYSIDGGVAPEEFIGECRVVPVVVCLLLVCFCIIKDQ